MHNAQPVRRWSVMGALWRFLVIAILLTGVVIKWRHDHRRWMSSQNSGNPPEWAWIASEEGSAWYLNTRMRQGAAVWKRVPLDNNEGRADRAAEMIHLTRLGVSQPERYASTHYVVRVSCGSLAEIGDGAELSIVRMDSSDSPLQAAETNERIVRFVTDDQEQEADPDSHSDWPMTLNAVDRRAPCWFKEHAAGVPLKEIPTAYLPPNLLDGYREAATAIWGEAAVSATRSDRARFKELNDAVVRHAAGARASEDALKSIRRTPRPASEPASH